MCKHRVRDDLCEMQDVGGRSMGPWNGKYVSFEDGNWGMCLRESG